VNARLLLLFSRYPTPGKVKTRLIPGLGAEGAASLQRCLTRHILGVARRFVETAKIDLEVWFDGSRITLMQRMFGMEFCYRPQGGGDLGQRMVQAFAAAFGQGRRQVVLMGSDCPEISEALLAESFFLLEGYDLVLGPAKDGGYYLIGLRTWHPELFRDIPWGTGEVLEKTLAAARRLKLPVALLESLTDIDRPEDLAVWARISQRSGDV